MSGKARSIQLWLTIQTKFPIKPMGILAPKSAHARPSARAPHIRNPRTTFENTPLFPPKCSIVQGLGGVPDFF